MNNICYRISCCGAACFSPLAINAIYADESIAAHPNVLLIITDQQSFNMMSCAGNKYVHTPNMDRIAENGYLFSNTYCSNPVSMPSRFSLMTGQFSSKVRLKNNTVTVKRERVHDVVAEYSMGNVFRANGYKTYYSGKTHFFAEKTAMDDYGFEIHGQDPYDGPAVFAEEFFADSGNLSSGPFLMVLSFMNPHDICYAAGKNPNFFTSKLNDRKRAATLKYMAMKDSMSRDEFLAEVPPMPENMDTIPEYKAKFDDVYSGYRDWTEEEWMTYRWMYRKLTEDVDSLVGRVLAALESSGLADETIVVFTSDHGEMQQAHGLVHKSRLLEECQRVPFIFMGKGIRKNTVDKSTLVCNGTDLAPTLYDLAGIEVPAGLPGISLKAYLTGVGKKPERDCLVLESSSGMQIHDGRYKYSVLMEMGCTKTLYDIKKDPGEQSNLVYDSKYAKKVSVLHTILEKEAASRGRDVNKPE